MTTTAGTRRKRKPARRKPPDDSNAYRPGLTHEEKAAQHRKAQSIYYAGNPAARERRRLQAAERRTASKLKKRRWDPPPKPPKPSCSDSVHPAGSVSGQGGSDDRESSAVQPSNLEGLPSAARGESPTSDEQIACVALAKLAEGAAGRSESSASAHFRILSIANQLLSSHDTPSVDSVLHRQMRESSDECDFGRGPSLLEKIDRLSSGWSASSAAFADDRTTKYPTPQGITSLPAGVTPLTNIQEISLRVTGWVGALTPVQAAQLEVAKLNSGTLTRPTSEDAKQWGGSEHGRQTLIEWSGSRRLVEWHLGVLRAKRWARKAGHTCAAEVLEGCWVAKWARDNQGHTDNVGQGGQTTDKYDYGIPCVPGSGRSRRRRGGGERVRSGLGDPLDDLLLAPLDAVVGERLCTTTLSLALGVGHSKDLVVGFVTAMASEWCWGIDMETTNTLVYMPGSLPA
ncbi:hypothetical protein C8R43DRAFT_953070 [Mycena crocata]|nr:hypothetical protein C8R43DRAFT_953070 [Mycena crocata]